jgi:hypothetical protein
MRWIVQNGVEPKDLNTMSEDVYYVLLNDESINRKIMSQYNNICDAMRKKQFDVMSFYKSVLKI